MTVRSTET
jgi:hypothetical protein